MPLQSEHMQALSRLLDEALDLPHPQRAAWFAALPEADRHLAADVHEILADSDRARRSASPSNAFAGLPVLPRRKAQADRHSPALRAISLRADRPVTPGPGRVAGWILIMAVRRHWLGLVAAAALLSTALFSYLA